MNYRHSALLLLLASVLCAEKPINWEHGTVISQNLNARPAGAYTAPIGNGTAAVPIYRRSNVVVIETEGYRYEWQEQGRNPIILNVNEQVAFYRDGNWFIVLDIKGKKHKFALTSSVRR